MGSDILSQSEIDNLLSSLTSGLDNLEDISPQETATSLPVAAYMEDPIQEEDKKGYKLYNFRRPDKFSKDHLRALQDIHKEFSRQLALILSAYLRMHIDIEIISVDQLTYDEFARSMPNPITIGIVELNPLPGQILLGMSHEVTSCIVDRMLGGTGDCETKPRELTDIEEALAKRVLEKMTKTLEGSWKSVLPTFGKVIGIDNNYTVIQIASLGEIVALITFEVQISGKLTGLLSLCFPFPVLESVLSQLSSQHIFQSKGIINSTEDKQEMIHKLNNTMVKLNVILGSTNVTVNDLIELKIGDVLKLDSNVENSLTIKVNDIPKFFGRPGTKKNKLAINITDTIDNFEEQES